MRLGVDVCMIVMPSCEDKRVGLTLLDERCSGAKSGRLASFVSITRNWARVPSSSMFRSSICLQRMKVNQISCLKGDSINR